MTLNKRERAGRVYDSGKYTISFVSNPTAFQKKNLPNFYKFLVLGSGDGGWGRGNWLLLFIERERTSGCAGPEANGARVPAGLSGENRPEANRIKDILFHTRGDRYL